MTLVKEQASNQSTDFGKFFDEFIATLRVHELELETKVASPELKDLYNTIINGDVLELARINKETARFTFVKQIVTFYLQQLKKIPEKLAFDYDDSLVLVWAEIKDNDEAMEDMMLLAEAKVNAKFHQYGFDMNSTIVEKSDNLPIPNHYRLFKS